MVTVVNDISHDSDTSQVSKFSLRYEEYPPTLKLVPKNTTPKAQPIPPKIKKNRKN